MCVCVCVCDVSPMDHRQVAEAARIKLAVAEDRIEELRLHLRKTFSHQQQVPALMQVPPTRGGSAPTAKRTSRTAELKAFFGTAVGSAIIDAGPKTDSSDSESDDLITTVEQQGVVRHGQVNPLEVTSTLPPVVSSPFDVQEDFAFPCAEDEQDDDSDEAPPCTLEAFLSAEEMEEDPWHDSGRSAEEEEEGLEEAEEEDMDKDGSDDDDQLESVLQKEQVGKGKVESEQRRKSRLARVVRKRARRYARLYQPHLKEKVRLDALRRDAGLGLSGLAKHSYHFRLMRGQEYSDKQIA